MLAHLLQVALDRIHQVQHDGALDAEARGNHQLSRQVLTSPAHAFLSRHGLKVLVGTNLGEFVPIEQGLREVVSGHFNSR